MHQKKDVMGVCPLAKLLKRNVLGKTMFGVSVKPRHCSNKLITSMEETEESAWNKAYQYLTIPPFMNGDNVIMFDCGEATLPNYKDKVLSCSSNAFLSENFEWHVFLKETSGYFSCQFLKKID